MNNYKEVFLKMYYEIFDFVNTRENKRLYFGGDSKRRPFFADSEVFIDDFQTSYHITALRITNNKLECYVDFCEDAELCDEEEFWGEFQEHEDYNKNWRRVNDFLTVVSIHLYVKDFDKNYKEEKLEETEKEEKLEKKLKNNFEIIL